MAKPKVTDMIIKSNDAGLFVGSTTKAKLAQDAVEAVEGVRAKKAVTDKDGKIVEPAVEAVKAVKAKPAVEAVESTQTMFLKCKTESVVDEVIARMAANGFEMEGAEAPVECDYGFSLKFRIKFADHGAFRAAFKKCKTEDNQPGRDKKAAAEKAEKEAEAKKAKEAKAAEAKTEKK